MAVATTDGGSTDDTRFEAALGVAHDAVTYEPTVFEQEEFVDWATPHHSAGDVLVETLAWAMFPTWEVLRTAVRADRLDDEDGAAPVPDRVPRTFLFGRDDDSSPAFVVRGSFVNRWDDQRVVIDTPAPWETPDEMTSGNDLIKELEWDDYHYSFEDNVHQTDDEDVWVIDADGVDPLRELAEEAGFEWVEDPRESEDAQTLAEVAQFLRDAEVENDDGEWKLVGGDEVTIRYESKQTGDVKEKAGTVTGTRTEAGDPGFSFERPDGKTNRVEADDGEVGIYSTSRYPFMGTVVSVEVRPE